MFGIVIDVLGTLTLALGWVLIIYALHRNQKAAVKSDVVDDTNFGPRVAAIVETTLHPDHAAIWLKKCKRHDADIIGYEVVSGTPLYLNRVFPALGQDSSEQYGIREDDGKAT